VDTTITHHDKIVTTKIPYTDILSEVLKNINSLTSSKIQFFASQGILLLKYHSSSITEKEIKRKHT
jgi:hypothetical protein